MSDKITHKFDFGIAPFTIPNFRNGAGSSYLLGLNPPASFDNHGNQHIGDFLVCAGKHVLPFESDAQDKVFKAVEIASMGKDPKRTEKATSKFLGMTTDGTLEFEYDLGELPSPLQTLCQQHNSGEIER
ncbi:hypothetical protein K1718_27460 (plasmid) [Roseibium porphyridii]|uniref:Uncharacterized protein n=1 Tax=Roseibium porphyridii TaxID=2866279 RepID=A0ABY8FFK4_9HYPH|nr:hypothetical protein [Roseibium sp. KMA01]WFE92640.1 hypothetical protein K1718_27460 [Roseibium sp. KMA01]